MAETPLNKSQIAVASRIIELTSAECLPKDTINFAVKIAFLESSLGLFNSNGIAGNTSRGLYQYNNDQWAVSGGGGSQYSNDDQIKAFIRDIKRYTARYNSLAQSKASILSGITVYQYIYIKHHDGTNYTDFVNSPGRKIFDTSQFNPPKEARYDVITECKVP
jgi:hypothetical protein